MAWETLLGLIQEQAETEQEERTGTPSSCATCYTPLKDGPGGVLFCPWDGRQWPRDAALWGEYPGSF